MTGKRTRRGVLAAVGLAATAGCTDAILGTDGEPTSTETPTDTATRSPTASPEPTPTPEPFEGRWPMFATDARNAGVAEAPGPSDPGTAWRFEAAGRLTTDAVVADGTVVVGSLDRNVYAVAASDGTEQWRFPLPSEPSGTPAVHGGRVFVGTEDDGVYALDLAGGSRAWRRRLEAGFRPGAVTVHDGTVYAVVAGGVVGLDPASGDVRTRLEVDGRVRGPPAIADGVVYVPWDREDGPGDRSCGLDAVGLDGERRWRVETASPWGAPAVADGTVVWTTTGAALAHDAATGEDRWRFGPASSTGSPAVADGVAYLGSDGSSFHAVDVASGEARWSVETTARPSVAPVVAGDAVYYGSGAYRVYARDVASGEKRWYRSIGWLPSDPALAGGTLFVTAKTELVALRDP